MRITLKLAWPAALGSMLILFVRSIESFENPALLGLPVGIQVFTSSIYEALHAYPSDVGLASTYAITLLKNGVSAGTCTIASGAGSPCTIAGPVAFAAGDSVEVQIVRSSLTGNSLQTRRAVVSLCPGRPGKPLHAGRSLQTRVTLEPLCAGGPLGPSGTREPGNSPRSSQARSSVCPGNPLQAGRALHTGGPC